MIDSLLRDLTVAILSSTIAGAIAIRLRVPVIVAYLASGVVIGPHGFGWISAPAQIDRLAELGVGFLMFILGVEVSLSRLRTGWKAWLGGAALQMGGTMLGSVLMLAWLGLGWRSGLAIGCILALSSTALVLHMLETRGELDALYGRMLTGILVIQDLAVLPMVLLLPGLAGKVSLAFLSQVVVGAVFLGLALGLGPRIVTPLLSRAAALRSREAFFLTVIGLCLGLAWIAQAGGLNLAIGAFLAGLVVSEAPQSQQALAEVGPLRDLFAVVFFVSLGMLLDPLLVGQHWTSVLWLLTGIVLGKTLLGTLAAWAAGHSGRISLSVGLGLAQIGEFSFVLAGIAHHARLLDDDWLAILLGASTASLVMAPFLMQIAGPLGLFLDRHVLGGGWWRGRSSAPETEAASGLRDHVVIAGYGRMGQQIGAELHRWQVPFLAVDLDHARIEQLRTHGEAAIFGDAVRPEVLRPCGLSHARLMIIALPDSTSAELCLGEAKRMAPHLPVVVRANDARDVALFHRMGATEVIQPAFEAGLEAIRRALGAYGFDPREIAVYLHKVRASRYVAFREDAPLDFGALPPLSPEGLDLHWYEVEPGSQVLTHAIQDLEYPLACGVVMLAIRRHGRTLPVPSPRSRLLPHDQVLILGTRESLERFAALAAATPGRLAGGHETD